MVCLTSIFRAENSVKVWAAQFKLQKQVGKKKDTSWVRHCNVIFKFPCDSHGYGMSAVEAFVSRLK